MTTAVEMVASGTSAGSARGINGQQNLAITAAGTTISDATALSAHASHNVVTTATANQGVLLPDSEIGDEYYILNNTLNAILVYPPSGARILPLSASTGMSLASNTGVKLKKATATSWTGLLSA